MEAIMHLDRSETAMETNQADDNKFTCKFCKKKFTCGKSLGGHIRIHFNKSSKRSNNRDKQEEFNTSKIIGGQYGLRENPKKSSRFVLDSSIDSDCLVCKECGKGFQSLKALCGHMACHSKNNSFDDQSGSSDKIRDMVMVVDGYSDTETSGPSNRRRSKRIRYKTVDPNYSSSLTSIANGDSFWDSDTEQEEQEEVAMCLMMLSRDSGNFSPAVDRNSVVLEDKSSSRFRFCEKEGVDFVNNEVWGQVELQKVKDEDWFVNSGSDQLPSEVNRVKSNESKKKKLDCCSKSDKEFDAEFVERLHGSKKIRTCSDDDVDETDDNGIHQDCNIVLMKEDSHNGRNKFNSSVRLKTNEDQGKFPSIGVKIPAGHLNSSSKSKKKSSSRRGKVHKCPFCPKVFKSGQALGGHKRSHFIGSGEDRTFVIKEDEGPESDVPIPSLIDLNLPPNEEDNNESIAL